LGLFTTSSASPSSVVQTGCFFTYTLEVIQRVAMVDCKPFTTAVDIQAKLAADYGLLVQDASQFRSIACALQDLTFTRLGIAYVVQQIFLHMHDP
jgi:hypothetical protein